MADLLLLQKNRLNLGALQGMFQCLRDHPEISNQRSGLLNRIILTERNKIIMLSYQQPSDIFCGSG